jgi:coproporphyrinogen III oxidase-like Fe-S oxidoreductase
VFFGGGTPSLMPPAAVAAVLDAIAANWPVAPDVEVTLEANPTSARRRTSPATARPASIAPRSASRRSTTAT